MRTAFVESIAVVGPGLADWREAAAVLRAPVTYVPREVVVGNAVAMTANEYRRTTPLIRLALQVLAQLSGQTGLDLARAASVFATSWGDSRVVDTVLCALTAEGVPVSPVHFHNIVHNTPAGYWSIGAGAHGPSTSLTAADATVAVGFVEAFVTLDDADIPLLLACYDYPLPSSWDRFHHIEAPFAAALTLTRQPTDRSLAALTMEIVPERPETEMAHPGLEKLRLNNPSARILPILQAIATGAARWVFLRSTIGGSSIAIQVEPLRRPMTNQDTEAGERVTTAA